MAGNLAKKVIKVQINIKLPFKITKGAKWFLASCPILDVHSQGETEKQAKKNLIEAISLFLASCFQRGTLDEVLKKCGFTLIQGIPGLIKTIPVVTRENYINVPIPFLVESGPECRA